MKKLFYKIKKWLGIKPKKRVDYLYLKAKENNDLNCESLFKESPIYSYLYALNVLKKRLSDEGVFLKDMNAAYQYARDVVKDQLPIELEETFFNNKVKSFYFGEYDCDYDESVVILDSFFYINQYYKNVVRKKLNKKLHNFMVENKNNIYSKEYIESLKE